MEPWEVEKEEEDMEFYDWERNKSKEAYIALKYWPKKLTQEEMKEVSLEGDEIAEEYKNAVTDLFYQGNAVFEKWTVADSSGPRGTRHPFRSKKSEF